MESYSLYTGLQHGCAPSNYFFLSWMLNADAYDALDPNGNITIKWDVMSWTPDGYVVSTVKLFLPYISFLLSTANNLF